MKTGASKELTFGLTDTGGYSEESVLSVRRIDFLFGFFKKRNWGYPECDHLNIALRFLLEGPFPDERAIEEICFAITKTNGYFYDDVKEMLVDGGFWKF